MCIIDSRSVTSGGGKMIESLRHAVRALRRDPILWSTATFTLALCIGANTTVFSLVNSILLRPLPFPDSGRIYWVSERMGKSQAEVGLGADYYLSLIHISE